LARRGVVDFQPHQLSITWLFWPTDQRLILALLTNYAIFIRISQIYDIIKEKTKGVQKYDGS
jgi:hypothetical protein